MENTAVSIYKYTFIFLLIVLASFLQYTVNVSQLLFSHKISFYLFYVFPYLFFPICFICFPLEDAGYLFRYCSQDEHVGSKMVYLVAITLLL